MTSVSHIYFDYPQQVEFSLKDNSLMKNDLTDVPLVIGKNVISLEKVYSFSPKTIAG